jgi:hypothetical protein
MKNLKSRPGREPGLTRPTIRRRGVRNSVFHERHGFQLRELHQPGAVRLI